MTRRAAALYRALPPRRPSFDTTLSDLTAAYRLVNARVDWAAVSAMDPFRD